MITLGKRRVMIVNRPGDLTPLTCAGCMGRIHGEDHTIVERKGVRMRFCHQCAQVESYDQTRESLKHDAEVTIMIPTAFDQEVIRQMRN